MRRKRFAFAGDQVVGKHVQFARSDDPGIELPDRARGGVARICKARFTLLFSFRIGSLEHVSRYEHFARTSNSLPTDFPLARSLSGTLRIVRAF